MLYKEDLEKLNKDKLIEDLLLFDNRLRYLLRKIHILKALLVSLNAYIGCPNYLAMLQNKEIFDNFFYLYKCFENMFNEIYSNSFVYNSLAYNDFLEKNPLCDFFTSSKKLVGSFYSDKYE